MTASNSESASKSHKVSEQSVDDILSSPGRHGDIGDFKKYLRKNGLLGKIFVDIPGGAKRQQQFDHTDPDNWTHWDELYRNRAIMPAGQLAFIDIDDIGAMPDWVLDLPETLTVQSPHGGYHFYYLIDGDVYNRQRDWGEVRAENLFVMAPGSTIDHDNFCDDCGYSGEGRYEVFHSHEIAFISADPFPDSQVNETAQNVQEQDTEVDLSWDVDFHVKSRLRKAKNGKHGERFTALWEGRYKEMGHIAEDGSADTSTGDMELLCRLVWWMERDTAVVRGLMTQSCNESPTTRSGKARKWGCRKGTYRDISVRNALSEVDGQYDPGDSHCGPRPEVSRITRDKVMEALLDLNAAQIDEIADHDAVDRSKQQVRRALRQYEEDDLVARTRSDADGRKIYYYLPGFEAALPEEKRDRIGFP